MRRSAMLDDVEAPMLQRLLAAAERLERASLVDREDDGAVACAEARTCATTLRHEQSRVLADAADYLVDVATRPAADARPPYGRIVLPPRTGKTVVAAHLLRHAELSSLFIVPTRTLVEQTVAELARTLPDCPVGTYYGERRAVVRCGVNVATYAILHARANELPAPIRRSAVVLVDEAHHSMTKKRRRILDEAFDPSAVRIGLTATPDYDDARVLARFFPDLIHEISLEEAMELRLLAPARVWVAEVDVDGSSVRLVAGDFDASDLGRVLSTTPLFSAVARYRDLAHNRDKPALIACATRQQAHDLRAFLAGRRAPPPALILGETPRAERLDTLRRFEAGELDTLVQVGVLIEGWSSPRCKLLFDLAPSASRVRATQKYFRVMTRSADREAGIYVLLPRGLPACPILPMELFGRSAAYSAGDLLWPEPDNTTKRHRPPLRHRHPEVAGVTLRHRITWASRLEAPLLDRKNPAQIRTVLRSCSAFDPAVPCGVGRFRWLELHHRLFRGRGDSLLRWLGVAPTNSAYLTWLARVDPDAATARFLLEARQPAVTNDRPCWEDAARLREAIATPGTPSHRVDVPAGWRAATGATDPPRAPDDEVFAAEVAAALRRALSTRTTQAHRVLRRHHGLFGAAPMTYAEIAAEDGLSNSRIAHVDQSTIERLWRPLMWFVRDLGWRPPPWSPAHWAY